MFVKEVADKTKKKAPHLAFCISRSPNPLDMAASPVHAALGATTSEADPAPWSQTKQRKKRRE